MAANNAAAGNDGSGGRHDGAQDDREGLQAPFGSLHRFKLTRQLTSRLQPSTRSKADNEDDEEEEYDT